MEKVLALFKQEIEVTKLQFNIRERVEENLSEHQRDFFLRQQLNEIQKELGMVKDDPPKHLIPIVLEIVWKNLPFQKRRQKKPKKN